MGRTPSLLCRHHSSSQPWSRNGLGRGIARTSVSQPSSAANDSSDEIVSNVGGASEATAVTGAAFSTTREVTDG